MCSTLYLMVRGRRAVEIVWMADEQEARVKALGDEFAPMASTVARELKRVAMVANGGGWRAFYGAVHQVAAVIGSQSDRHVVEVLGSPSPPVRETQARRVA